MVAVFGKSVRWGYMLASLLKSLAIGTMVSCHLGRKWYFALHGLVCFVVNLFVPEAVSRRAVV